MMESIRRLDLSTVIGNAANAREYLSLFDAIESSRFWDFPAASSCRGIFPRLAHGRTDGVADYPYFKHFPSCFMNKGEVCTVLRGKNRRLPNLAYDGFGFQGCR